MIFGKCSDCCKICCCLPGEGEGQSYVDRTKSKRQCEQAGGTVVECPSIPPCPCICTPTVTMKNGAAVPILEDAFDIVNAAEIGVVEPPTLVCTDGWVGTRWRFVAGASFTCFLFGYETNWLRLVVWPQLYVFNGINWQNLTLEYGQASVGYWFQDYYFPHQAAVGSGFPCPKDEAVLQYSSFPGHPGSDAPTFLCAARPDWAEELNTIAEQFFPPTLSLECEPYVENCEEP